MQSKLHTLELNVQMNWLIDFYGGLLTTKQQEMLQLHFEEDLSLAEIAEQFGISRQGVRDIVQRACKHLQHYEEKLHLVERTLIASEQLNQALKALQAGKANATKDYIQVALSTLGE